MSDDKTKKTRRPKPPLREVTLESGIHPKPVYGPEDLAGRDWAEDIGNPGEYPFTRGIHGEMYRRRPFTMRQYAGFGTPTETNERFQWLIENGQTGLNVAFDLPTQLGFDSDHPMAEGEVGRVGMAIDTLADFEEAFREIPMDRISVSLTINSMAPVMIAMVAALVEKRGFDVERMPGNAQNDILKEFVGRGTWIYPVEDSVRLVGDTIEWCKSNMPRYNPVSVCGYHIRESGANPQQEMAFAFEIARAYIDHVMERGLSADDVASRLSFNFDIYGNIFEQVAKFRAGRRLWARMMKEDYGCTNPRSMWMRMIAGGGGGGLTIEQPENNIVRGAYYALISALSGTQTMALCSYDEAYTIPSERAAQISLRTMQMLVEEMGLADTVDPLAGSYYVESLTNEIEELIIGEMQQVRDAGGVVEGIATGRVQNQVSRQAYQTELAIQRGEVKKVGVNCYRTDEEQHDVEMHPYRNEAQDEQIRRLEKVRAERDDGGVRAALERLTEDAGAKRNVMPALVEAVKAYATVGEMAGVFREVYGEFREPEVI
jgi:methylmalonyl-CoA mutase, N-terminal domain